MSETDPAGTIELAQRIATVLDAQGAPSLVIGAIALAAHNYPRATNDLDLAVSIPPARLVPLADALRAEGWDVVLRSPDAADPLGGVIDVRNADGAFVQIVNFDNAPSGGFPRLVREALPRATPLVGTLRVVDLPMLIAFKLYAGGAKSALDILELIDRNAVDLASLRAHLSTLGLVDALDRVLAFRTPDPR